MLAQCYIIGLSLVSFLHFLIYWHTPGVLKMQPASGHLAPSAASWFELTHAASNTCPGLVVGKVGVRGGEGKGHCMQH